MAQGEVMDPHPNAQDLDHHGTTSITPHPGRTLLGREIISTLKVDQIREKNKLVLQTVMALPRLPDKEVYA